MSSSDINNLRRRLGYKIDYQFHAPIDKKNPLKYGTNQIAHTTRLNLWKFTIACSSLRIRTIVAHMAWISMSSMATNPVNPWISNVIPPAISNMIPVPVVSKTNPPQKNISAVQVRAIPSGLLSAWHFWRGCL